MAYLHVPQLHPGLPGKRTRIRSKGRATDQVVEPGDPEFRVSGLKTASLIRLNKLATLHRVLIRACGMFSQSKRPYALPRGGC